jgi:hypothetical protein
MHEITIAQVVAALRSGKYSQTIGCLHDDNGFCCLGVAEDLAGAKWKESAHADKSKVFYRDDYDEPGATCQEAGVEMGEWGNFLFADEPFTCSDQIIDRLTSMNDERVDFNEIANWIEKAADMLRDDGEL